MRSPSKKLPRPRKDLYGVILRSKSLSMAFLIDRSSSITQTRRRPRVIYRSPLIRPSNPAVSIS